MIILDILSKSFWAGVAAIGFAVLFNVPRRVIFPIWTLGALGGLIKFTALQFESGIVFASFLGATFIGIISIQMAHMRHSPPLVFSIPSVIPMVPGFFAYKMMLGLIALTSIENTDAYLQNLIETVNNGAKMTFVLIALGTGVAIPMLITRKESIKKSPFNKRKKANVLS
ncbi:MAG: threonine/serine exporter family protein [Bacteroidota bacterium]|nr:threonine/serine exporter [Odoribacter sp.]MDP3642908.1 threonine/serine exporter family protein [Bacteroidota bacterium]